jgi:hypothetical protein
MHRLVLLLLLLSTPALAAPFQETMAVSRGAPSGNPLDKTLFPVTPMALVGVTRYRVILCPPPTATITAGTLRLYIYNQALGRWSFDADMDVFPGSTAPGACAHRGVVNDIRQGFIYPTPNSMTLSSGTTVTVRVEPDAFGL